MARRTDYSALGSMRPKSYLEDYDPSRPLPNAHWEVAVTTFIATGSWRKAMVSAGMKESYGAWRRFLGRPEVDGKEKRWVAKRIEQLQAEVAAKVVENRADFENVTKEEVISLLRRVVIDGFKGGKAGRQDLSSVTKAADLLGKSIGMYTEKRILEEANLDFDSMSDEQVQEVLASLMGQVDPNKLRSILGRNTGRREGDEVPALGEDESDQDVSSVPEAEDVPPTRH